MKRAPVLMFVVLLLAGCSFARPAADETRPEPAASSAPIVEEPAAPSATASQINAARKAESYLSFAAFSRSGLIKQLEFEGFTTEDATYGVDAQGADWSAQAALKAADYNDMTGFSHSGLVDQLVFEGFTPDEAEFGVTSIGL